MKTWNNGDKASIVKKIIDDNFDTLNTRITKISKIYVKKFTTSDWFSGVISIPYSEYVKTDPCVELYKKDNDGYSVVHGGYKINNYGIELQSDMAYEGKVVIR